MSYIRKLSAVTVGCLLVMGGLGASALAEQSDPTLAEAGKAMNMVADYVHSIEVRNVEVAVDQIGQQIAVYVQAQEAAAAAARAELVRQRNVVAVTNSTASTSSGSTGGGHSDAWWHGVANCEQGGRNDPYFGYFSFMDGSQGGRPWADQVAAGNALLARAGREVGPWAAACVAAGYNASPGG